MKQWSEILRNVTMLSQLGLSLITPLLLCLAVCWLIVSKTGVGSWIFIPGFFFGMGGRKKIKYLLTDIYKTSQEAERKLYGAYIESCAAGSKERDRKSNDDDRNWGHTDVGRIWNTSSFYARQGTV